MLSPQPSSLTIIPPALVVVALEPSVMCLRVLKLFTVVVPRVVHVATRVWARVILVLRTTLADMLSHVVTLVVTLLVVTVIGMCRRRPSHARVRAAHTPVFPAPALGSVISTQ